MRSALLALSIAMGLFTISGLLDRTSAWAQSDVASAALPPIPEGDVNAVIKEYGLPESEKTAKELVPGWTKPKMMLVRIDRPDRIAWLQKAVPGVKLVGVYQRGDLAQNEAEAMPYVANADALIYARPTMLCTENIIKAAKKLKWIQQYGAGVDDCADPSPEVAAGKFLFTNGQKLHNEVADNPIAMAVALMRGIDLFVRMDMEQHVKQPDFGQRGWQIAGRTLLVVGLGGVGTAVAKDAHGLGMKVIATRESSHQGPDFVDYVGLSSELPDLIGKADVVVSTVPLTAETKGMFNAALFAHMKKGAIFVSTSREDVIVEPDLAAALRSGQLGAAGMNVNNEEPLADHDPLWSAPNMLIITHGGAPKELPDGPSNNLWLVIRENMRRYAAGDKMLNLVDMKRGY